MAFMKALGFAAAFAVVGGYYVEKAIHYGRKAIDAYYSVDSDDMQP